MAFACRHMAMDKHQQLEAILVCGDMSFVSLRIWLLLGASDVAMLATGQTCARLHAADLIAARSSPGERCAHRLNIACCILSPGQTCRSSKTQACPGQPRQPLQLFCRFSCALSSVTVSTLCLPSCRHFSEPEALFYVTAPG